MEGFRKVLAFPMYAAAGWLAWVFVLQTGAGGLPPLFAAALAVAFAAFCWGVAQRSARRALPAVAGLGAVLAGVAALAGGLGGAATPAAVGVTGASNGAGGLAGAAPWSLAEVTRLQGAGRPVFVDFTAAWCVTCQVNERTTLSDPAVTAAFGRTGAAYLKADWTRPNPDIARALAAQGRSGVPLYLVYPRSSGQPRVLPQLLTPSTVTQALDQAARG
jgi:thiol:disulfide interchange protein